MNKLKILLSSAAAMFLAACTTCEDEDSAWVCHFPDPDSDEFWVMQVASDELEEYIIDEGDLCFGGLEEDACYEPDFDGWEEGGPLCPS